MLTNAYLLAKIGADTAENEHHFAEILPIGRCGAGADAVGTQLGRCRRDRPRRGWGWSSKHPDIPTPSNSEKIQEITELPANSSVDVEDSPEMSFEDRKIPTIRHQSR